MLLKLKVLKAYITGSTGSVLMQLASILVLIVPCQALATAHYRAAVGADIEVLTRRPGLVVVAPLTRINHLPDVAGSASNFNWDGQAHGLAIAQSGFVSVMVDGTAAFVGVPTSTSESASSGGWVHASVTLGLLNNTDSVMPVDVRVSIPGRQFPDLTANEYLDDGSVDSDPSEVSRVQYGVRLVAESAVTGLGPDGIFVLQVNRSTRDGPGNVFNSFGVPFSNTYRLMVPPSVAVNGSSVEFRVFDLGLWVYAEGLAVSLFSGNAGSLPLTAVPSFQIDPNAPLALPQHANQVQSVPIDSLVTLVILGLLIVASAVNKVGRGWY